VEAPLMASAADAPVVRDSPDVRNARQLAYFVVLAQEAHIDPKRVLPGQLLYAVASPYERRGYTSADIEGWIATCDPEIKPPWDEVTCFREKARDALQPPPSLALRTAVIGGAAFLAAFWLTRRFR
jgi:hypothetical protein